MPKALSYEALFTALAVLGTTAACKSEKSAPAPSATAEPMNQAPAATNATPLAPPPAEAPVTNAPPPPAASIQKAGPGFPPGTTPSVEPAKETAPKPTVNKNKKGSAACGAGACSDDMKK